MKASWKRITLSSIIMLLIIGGLSGSIWMNEAEAASNVKISKTTYQTTSNLNLRTGAGTKYSLILTIPKGKIVYATEKKGSWYKVTYKYTSKGKSTTKSGWVSVSYLKEYYQYIKTPGTYYFTKKTTKLYPTADTKKKASYSIVSKNGFYSTQKVINSLGQTWYRVSFNGKTLYLSSSNVSKATSKVFTSKKYKAKVVTSIYENYGNAYKTVASIDKDQILSSAQSIGDWYKVSYENKTGYIYIGDFEEVIEDENPNDGNDEDTYTEENISGITLLINETTNLNQLAAESSEILTTIPKGKIVTPTHKTSNGWYKIGYGGKIGYVDKTYLQEVKTGDPLTNRDGYQFIDLRTKSKVTATQINNYIESYVKSTGKTSVLTGKGQVFINAGEKFGVNALYLAAHAIHESAYGTSNISLGKYNLFGFAAYDASPFIAAYRFSTVDENIEYIAQEIKATYLNPNSWKYKGAYLGFSTKTLSNTRIDANSEGMNFYYASDPYWGTKIASHMQKILSYNKADYSSSVPDKRVFSSPPLPSGSEVFPAQITAIAKQDMDLKNKKGDTASSAVLNKGKEFTLLEKTNDFWVKVQYEGKEYWIFGIKFDKYSDYLAVKNLGRVNIAGLNVRPDASTTNSPIAVLNLNEYIKLVLDKDGNITMNSSKTWYKVELSTGKTGWVSAQYIDRELK